MENDDVSVSDIPVSILVNYTSAVIDILLKDVPKYPATLGDLYVTRGNSSPKLHVPFRFDSDLDRYGADPIYNSLETEILLNSSMNKRLLNVYGTNKNSEIKGHKVLVATEYLKDSITDEKKLLLYSMSRPEDDISYKAPLDRHKPHIMNPNEDVVEYLFRDLKISPAYISFLPEADVKPGSIDYQVHFTFHDNLGSHFSGSEYHMNMNNLAINKLMTLLDVNMPEECIGKNVAVYTNYDNNKRRLYICGLTSYDHYLKNSAKFNGFRSH